VSTVTDDNVVETEGISNFGTVYHTEKENTCLENWIHIKKPQDETYLLVCV
jgi:calcineurin-like phosphoesterase family protein